MRWHDIGMCWVDVEYGHEDNRGDFMLGFGAKAALSGTRMYVRGFRPYYLSLTLCGRGLPGLNPHRLPKVLWDRIYRDKVAGGVIRRGIIRQIQSMARASLSFLVAARLYAGFPLSERSEKQELLRFRDALEKAEDERYEWLKRRKHKLEPTE